MTSITTLFGPDGHATEALSQLLRLTGIVLVHHSMDLVHDVTQSDWRKPDVQSGDIVDEYADRVDEFRPLFEKLRFLGLVPAKKEKYKYGLIGGAYITAVRKRIAFLSNLWNSGCRFEHIVLLGSFRALDPTRENLHTINMADKAVLDIWPEWRRLEQLPANEAEIMKAVWQQSVMPTELQGLPLSLVRTPFRQGNVPKKNPGLVDTLEQWRDAHHPGAGTCLLVYSQPGIQHAQVSALRTLGELHPVEVVGCDPGTAKLNVSQTLDSIAKVIHELAVHYCVR